MAEKFSASSFGSFASATLFRRRLLRRNFSSKPIIAIKTFSIFQNARCLFATQAAADLNSEVVHLVHSEKKTGHRVSCRIENLLADVKAERGGQEFDHLVRRFC